jgi:transposase InsO family protein
MENGPHITTKFFQAVCTELGVKKVFTTAHHSQSNGQVERHNRTILAALRGYVARRKDDWDDYIIVLPTRIIVGCIPAGVFPRSS